MSVLNALGYNNFPLPIGSIFAYAGSSTKVPPSYLLCLGQELAQSAYPELFDVIGSIYGVPVVGTNFIIPDLSVSFVQGASTSGAVVAPSGNASFSPFTLTSAQLPTMTSIALTGTLSGTMSSTGIANTNTWALNSGSGSNLIRGDAPDTSVVDITQTTNAVFAFSSGVSPVTPVQFPTVSLNPTSTPAAYEITYIIKAN